MPIERKIINLEGIDWKDESHYQDVIDGYFNVFIEDGAVSIGDLVIIENKEECEYDLDDNEYCVTFDKSFEDGYIFLTKELFSLEECKLLFGEDFNY